MTLLPMSDQPVETHVVVGEGCVIGDDAVIGAGPCDTKSVAPGLTVVGVPAKPLQRG